MKKLIAIILMLACLVVTTASAADLSKIEAHLPEAIDFTPFKTNDYSLYFNNYRYDAEIKSKNITLEYAPKNYSTYRYTLHFDVKIVASNSSVVAVPRIVESTSTYSDYKTSDLFIVNGENRYEIVFNSDGVMVLGKTGFAILEEIVASKKPVFIMPRYLVNSSTYSGYQLMSADKAIIKKFVADCHTSGLYDLASEIDDSVIITKFN